MLNTAPLVTSTYNVEYTDTYNGEANYAWARRFTLTHRGTDLALVRKVKRILKLNGVRCDTHYHGDTIEVRPKGTCTVIFIMYHGDVIQGDCT